MSNSHLTHRPPPMWTWAASFFLIQIAAHATILLFGSIHLPFTLALPLTIIILQIWGPQVMVGLITNELIIYLMYYKSDSLSVFLPFFEVGIALFAWLVINQIQSQKLKLKNLDADKFHQTLITDFAEQLPYPTMVTDAMGTIVYANPSMMKMFEPRDIIGTHFIRDIISAINAKMADELWQTLSSGNVWQGEFLNKNQTGLFWTLLAAVPIHNQNQSIAHYLVIQEDISERKELHSQLLLAKNRAEASVRAKSTFISTMSHEIRTPMNAILGFIELALDNESLSVQTRDYLLTANHSAQKLLTLISDILELSNLDSDRASIANDPIHLSSFINDLTLPLADSIQVKGLQLQIDISPELPKCIMSDKSRLSRILGKLLGNAIKFTKKGLVRLTISKRDSAYLEFSISDTGIGMSASQLKKIFHPFTQLDESDNRKHGGTGLGTTISRQLVQLLGGAIWVDSEPGIGSTFHFTLPQIVPECNGDCDMCKNTHKETIIPRKNQNSIHILLADDEEVNASLLSIQLKRLGHQVHLASNGREAVEIFKNQTCDLLLLDINMPEMNGPEAAKTIRAYEENTHVPIIFMTGGFVDDHREMCKKAEADDIIGKPISNRDLKTLIHTFFPDTSNTKSKPSSNLEAPLRIDGIDTHKGIENWQDQTAYFNALVSFKQKYTDVWSTLQQYINNDRFEDARFIVHTLLGLAGNLAMPRLYTVLKELRATLHSKNTIEAIDAGNKLRLELNVVFSGIDTLPTLQTPHATKKLSIEETQAVLKQLTETLERGEFDEALISDALSHLKKYVTNEQVTSFQTSIEHFDFKAATQTLNSLSTMIIES